MKHHKFIQCDNCGIQYKIVWDNSNFQEPIQCAGCGADEPEEIDSARMI